MPRGSGEEAPDAVQTAVTFITSCVSGELLGLNGIILASIGRVWSIGWLVRSSSKAHSSLLIRTTYNVGNLFLDDQRRDILN